VNNLNQYTSITHNGLGFVTGTADTNATVNVRRMDITNLVAKTASRTDDYFYEWLAAILGKNPYIGGLAFLDSALSVVAGNIVTDAIRETAEKAKVAYCRCP